MLMYMDFSSLLLLLLVSCSLVPSRRARYFFFSPRKGFFLLSSFPFVSSPFFLASVGKEARKGAKGVRFSLEESLSRNPLEKEAEEGVKEEI